MLGGAHAISPDAPCGHPALRSLGGFGPGRRPHLRAAVFVRRARV